MDDALSAFVNRWRFKGPPYPTSRDLLAELGVGGGVIGIEWEAYGLTAANATVGAR